jgi:hypothetical protein
MPRYQIVVGTSQNRPEDAAREAERLAAAAGGEQIGIAADVCCGSAGTDPAVFRLLQNIAGNVYECNCPGTPAGSEQFGSRMAGSAPPQVSATGPSGPLWVVYILIRHP